MFRFKRRYDSDDAFLAAVSEVFCGSKTDGGRSSEKASLALKAAFDRRFRASYLSGLVAGLFLGASVVWWILL